MLLATQYFLESCAYRGILVIARLGIGRTIRHEQHRRFRSGDGYALIPSIARSQIGMAGKFRKGKGAVWQLPLNIELAIKVAVRGKHILHMEARAIGITLGLLHSLERIVAFFFGFDHADRQRLRHLAHLHAQQIIGTPRTRAATAFATRWLNRRRRFQPEPLMIVIPLLA